MHHPAMWPFSRRPKAPPATWWRELATLTDRLDALESRREKDRAEFKELRGYTYALKRGKTAAQETPGDANDQPDVVGWRPPQVMPTAGLARRFKIGG